MRLNLLRKIIILVALVNLTGLAYGSEKPDIILDSMKEELTRSMNELSTQETPPYFISYTISDATSASIAASFGALRTSGIGRARGLYVDVRVGNHQLDNTHQMRDRGHNQGGYTTPLPVSIEDDPDAIKHAIWMETDKVYKEAVQHLIQIKANKNVKVEEEDPSDDFSNEEPQTYTGPLVTISPDIKKWEQKIKYYSTLFNAYPEITGAEVTLRGLARNKYFVNSEGTMLRHGRVHWRLTVSASTMADDGMQLYKFESFDARNEANLPGDKSVENTIKELIKGLLALRSAPPMEPYTGPAILSGKASAVFFHEIFGHRVEGHRQKDEKEGQTFTKQIDKPVLPDFISVFDDPAMERYAETDLNGYYKYDDEGVMAQRVDLVKNGILRNFLMSRSPIKGFAKSNGHGRAQTGYRPVGRQGTLVVESSRTVPMKQLRQQLIQLCKEQGKPYGLYFEDISGGFTMTQRYMPQAFNVNPIMVYRIYTDGRPDQLVRGVDLIGTPLTSFSKIVTCGKGPGVFNGYCGAESGTVLASAISPAVLTTQIEVQKKRKGSNKPPVLPAPSRVDPKKQKKSHQKNLDDDTILRALSDELDRSMHSLKIDKMETPYFIDYTVEDYKDTTIEAGFGGLVKSGSEHQRLLKVGLRVGDYDMDNTEFVSGSGMYASIMGHSGQIIIDDDYNTLRRDTWLITDNAYKRALEQLADKKAFIKNQVRQQEVPDFTPAKPLRHIEPLVNIRVDTKKWQGIVRRVSAVFKEFPAVHESYVQMQASVINKYYVNSEGTVVRQPQPLVSFVAIAITQTADGMTLKHHIPFYGIAMADLPNENELIAQVRQMASQMSTLSKAPVLDSFIGPVLFTGQASAELFTQIMLPHISGQQPPLSGMPQITQMVAASKWIRRLNRKVLPRVISIFDDPTRSRLNKKPLIGAYDIDDQGIPGKPVLLVQKGVLKNLLVGRRPGMQFPQSNGHGRAAFMASPGVQVSNLFITAEKGKSFEELKQKMLEMCKEQQADYGLIVKHFDNPTFTGLEPAMSARLMQNPLSPPLTTPVLVYRVSVKDGTTELVRGLSISELPLNDFKYISDVGNDGYLHHRLVAAAGGVMGSVYSIFSNGSGSGVRMPISILAPSLLFEEVEFEKIDEQQEKPPIMPHPYFYNH